MSVDKTTRPALPAHNWSKKTSVILTALRAGEPVTSRQADSVRRELTGRLDFIADHLFDHDVKSAQTETGEIVDLLEANHFASLQ